MTTPTPTLWIWRLILIVAAADREAANGMAVATGPGGEAELATFGVPLSADGTGPATYYACNTLMTTAMLQAAQTILASGTIPSVRAYRMGAMSGQLVATNSATAAGSINQAWSWEQALADATEGGLQEVASEQL